jgi:hypothetical protein
MRRILKTLIATGFLMLSAFSIQAFATNSTTLVNASGEYRPSESVRLHSALITNNTKVEINGNLTGDNTADNNKLYLFELKAYEDNLGTRTDYISELDRNTTIKTSIDLLEGQENTRLYSKFLIAIKKNNKYYPISNAIYITNSGEIAKSKLPYQDANSKKGLLIDMNMISDAFELGVKHAIVNFNLDQILGEGIDYTYEGKTYHFNKNAIATYDTTVSTFSNKSMQVTAVVVNSWNNTHKELMYPNVVKNNTAIYYGFNAKTKEGVETTRAIASFLAERYSGDNYNYGRVSNWVIGNEINNNENWNYMGPMDVEKYSKEFARSFRVFYTAIKAKSKNARLFFSVDYDWNYPKANKLKYRAKQVIDLISENINTEGNIDWNLAYHPYPLPLTSANFWDDVNTGQIKQDETTAIINFANLHVLTDYLKGANFRDTSGKVRRVILSEQGFTSKSPDKAEDKDLQAAAFAYAYYIADSDPYIDSFILSRQVDHPVETRDSLYFGLWNTDPAVTDKSKATDRKKIWAVFKNIDSRTQTLSQTEFAKKIIGINKWSDVIPNFKWKSLEK